ncbi:MAG: Holliday junction branch migration protein RuvA [Bacteroidales bacterium]
MIAQLHGQLIEKHPNRLVVDVHGVGYEVFVPLSTFYHLPETGLDVSLRIHTHVREDAILLFGFRTQLELQVFERLIAISGIGPKVAIAVLSGIDAQELAQAVQRGDVVRLTAIPGIGKKTAERIGLELKDRLPLAVAVDAERADQAGAADDLRADLLSALLNLGYHRTLAEKAVDKAVKVAGEATFEARLRRALGELAK